jgi:UDP-N-acetylmuramate dehydrogenase
MAKRRCTQPLEYPSAGSVFKRPRNAFAGALIEQAGLKGFSVGGAAVSEKHAGFIINRGGATSADVLALVEHIRAEVLERYGVLLHTEIIHVPNPAHDTADITQTGR